MRKENYRPSACSPACLLDTGRYIFHMTLLKTVPFWPNPLGLGNCSVPSFCNTNLRYFCSLFITLFNSKDSSLHFLGPLLFNIYLNDLLFFLKDVGICNFADNFIRYISDESLENVWKSLEKTSMLAIHWFLKDYMKLNTGK